MPTLAAENRGKIYPPPRSGHGTDRQSAETSSPPHHSFQLVGDSARGIRHQAGKHGCCCCTAEVVCALSSALADCDRKVRRQAEKALNECGLEVVDCCQQSCCGQNACCAPACGATAAPKAEGAAPAPAPAPPAPEAYFPPRNENQQTSYTAPRRSRLANLFGLIR